MAHHPHEVEPARLCRRGHRGVLLRMPEQAPQGGGLLPDLAQEHPAGAAVGLRLGRHLRLGLGRRRRVHVPRSRGMKTGAAEVRSRRLSSVTRR
jgi:hypothetical protein